MDAGCRPLSQQWRTSTCTDKITKGEGPTQRREFFVHICSAPVGSCKAVDSEDTFAFHTDVVRLLEVNDFRNRLWLWWQTGVAKADFEAFKARRGKQAVGDDEAISFNEDLPEDDDDGRDSQAAKERAVGENLARLKREVSREPLRRKKGAMPRSPRRREVVVRGDNAKKAKKRSSSGSIEKKRRRKSTSRERVRLRPAARSSSSADEKERRKKKRREPSDSPRRANDEKDAKRRKSRMERDRGPYGVGKAISFEKENSDDSLSASADEGFCGGGSGRRSSRKGCNK